MPMEDAKTYPFKHVGWKWKVAEFTVEVNEGEDMPRSEVSGGFKSSGLIDVRHDEPDGMAPPVDRKSVV